MSYPQFQSALALLLRLPNHYRGDDLGSFLAGYELNALEKERLELMAYDVKLAKYGRTMSGIRWEYITERLRWSLRYLKQSTVNVLWSAFEPTVPHLRGSQLAFHFLGRLLTDEATRQIVEAEGKPFLFDLFKVEWAQTKLWRNGGISVIPLPETTLLRHSQIEILKLEHDFPVFLELLSGPDENQTWKNGPTARSITLLVMEDQERQMRFFEIDSETEQFLQNQLSGAENPEGLPKSYSELQKINLCKTIN